VPTELKEQLMMLARCPGEHIHCITTSRALRWPPVEQVGGGTTTGLQSRWGGGSGLAPNTDSVQAGRVCDNQTHNVLCAVLPGTP
jgi:hypothetical protein